MISPVAVHPQISRPCSLAKRTRSLLLSRLQREYVHEAHAARTARNAVATGASCFVGSDISPVGVAFHATAVATAATSNPPAQRASSGMANLCSDSLMAMG